MSEFRHRYNHDVVASPSGDKISMTDPQFMDECDINCIIRKYNMTGQLPTNSSQLKFGDFTQIRSFEDCLNAVNRAFSEFNALPSNLRDRFGNNPRAYVDFVLDDGNKEECYKLGLRVRPSPASSDGVRPSPASSDGVRPASASSDVVASNAVSEKVVVPNT